MKIKLCGQNVKVVKEKQNALSKRFSGEGFYMGLSDATCNKIFISKEIDKSAEDVVLIHEILHFIGESCSFKQLRNEKLVSTLAVSLVSLHAQV